MVVVLAGVVVVVVPAVVLVVVVDAVVVVVVPLPLLANEITTLELEAAEFPNEMLQESPAAICVAVGGHG